MIPLNNNSDRVAGLANQLKLLKGLPIAGLVLLLGMAASCSDSNVPSQDDTATATNRPAASETNAAAQPESAVEAGESGASQEALPLDQSAAPPPLPSAGMTPPALQTPMQQFQQTRMELQQIDTQLSPLSAQVNEQVEVKEAREALEAAALARMKDATPNVQDQIDELQALGEKIESSGEVGPEVEGEPSEAVMADIRAFQQKRQALSGLEQAALNDPTMQPLRDDYQEKVTAAMKAADPQAAALLEKRDELVAKLQTLQKEIIESQIKQRQQIAPPSPPAPPPAPARESSVNQAPAEDASTPAPQPAEGQSGTPDPE